jgi:hypothetical protein
LVIPRSEAPRFLLVQRVQSGVMKMKSLDPTALSECADNQPAGELDLALGGASILQDGPGQLHDFGWDY